MHFNIYDKSLGPNCFETVSGMVQGLTDRTVGIIPNGKMTELANGKSFPLIYPLGGKTITVIKLAGDIALSMVDQLGLSSFFPIPGRGEDSGRHGPNDRTC